MAKATVMHARIFDILTMSNRAGLDTGGIKAAIIDRWLGIDAINYAIRSSMGDDLGGD